jgi:hypothetical protein
MGDERDRLALAYPTFFAEAEFPTPTADRLPIRVAIIETGRGRLQDAQLQVQLCLKAGAALETARTKLILSDKRVELRAAEVGGLIRQRGWKLNVDAEASLVWPVLPFNPYKNAPESDLRHAVGVLTVPLRVHPPTDGALNWRRGKIDLSLEITP